MQMTNAQHVEAIAVAGSLFAELLGMVAANKDRETSGHTPEYHERSFQMIAHRFTALSVYARTVGSPFFGNLPEKSMAQATGKDGE